MKIQYLNIRNYKQFSDLELDLTYPKGHEKAGKPLDKICIIGQSGTGKTNLLEIIRKKLYITEVKTSFLEDENSNSEKIYFSRVEKYSNGIIKNQKSIDFSQSDKNLSTTFDNNIIELNETSWKILTEKIDNYDTERLKYRDKLSNKLLNISDYSKEDFKREIEEWENENDNILDSISDKLNSILIRFNLKLHKIDENQTAYNDLTIEDLSNGNIIEYQYLSTGTKNLISTFIPLKIHKPKDSIILIDEPEMSFYPNIQRQLTDLYMEVGENNQLIMATHSPLIASSFEPWEVVELKFDRNNQIYREKYYEGENHIDNYTIDPRMLTWTGILTDVFDLKEDSNFSFREKKLMEYATLKAEIKAMESIEEKEKKFKELKKISKILGLDN